MNLPRDAIAFWGTAVALILAYASSSTPVPLYETWRVADGLTYSDLSLSSVIYFIGAVSALMFFGRLSDFLGRRPIAILAMLLAAISSVLFMFVDSALPLLLGRGLQGLASGLASTAMTAWIVDSAKPHQRSLPPLIISVSPLVGLSLGSLGGGALITYAPLPRTLVFLTSLALIIISTLMLCFARESISRKPGVLQSMKPLVGLPEAGKRWYPIAAITFTCTWAMGGFYQAFGPTIAAQYLHSTTAIAAAIVFASFMMPSIFGATLASKLTQERAVILGLLVFMVSAAGVAVSLYFGALVPFLICGALAGTAQGACMNGGIRLLMTGAQPHQRASTFSVIYATAYTGAAIPTLVVGRLTGSFSLMELVFGYAMLAVLGFALVSLLMLAQLRKQQLPLV
ncbi:MFS transporter [Oceanobacter mangrovi]|uniref:MFS transporter n=1 Tax=Oceanobacter mangrovi TaxID=2862510 RepID=UPI001C8D33CA|nr:MFS transporter [Oceanobacter mangrovi]